MKTRSFFTRACLFALSVAGLTATTALMGERFGQAWLPLLEPAVDVLLGDRYRRETLEARSVDGAPAFVLRATMRSAQRIGPAVLPAGTPLVTSMLQGYAAQHFVLILATLLAWPAADLRARLALLALGVPAVAVATMLDVPFVLTGLVDDLVLGTFAPEQVGASWAVAYYEFLHRGGRYALALFLAVAVALFISRVRRPAMRMP